MAFDTVGDLIKAFREDERDAVAPFFWSDNQLVRFVNGALTAFADKTKSIVDDDSAITQVDFAIGEDRLIYAEQIIDVIDAELVIGEQTWPLEVKSPAAVRRSCLPKNGRPSLLITNNATATMRLVPAPKEAGQVLLQVLRRPLRELDKDSRIPDVNHAHREYLLLYMKHRAYNAADAEVFDPAKASNYLAEFDRECQRLYEDELRRRGGARSIRYGG